MESGGRLVEGKDVSCAKRVSARPAGAGFTAAALPALLPGVLPAAAGVLNAVQESIDVCDVGKCSDGAAVLFENEERWTLPGYGKLKAQVVRRCFRRLVGEQNLPNWFAYRIFTPYGTPSPHQKFPIMLRLHKIVLCLMRKTELFGLCDFFTERKKNKWGRRRGRAEKRRLTGSVQGL